MTSDRTLWRAWCDTANFSFDAYGTTAAEAMGLLMDGMMRHGEQTGADRAFLRMAATEASCMRVGAGSCYRDSQPIPAVLGSTDGK